LNLWQYHTYFKNDSVQDNCRREYGSTGVQIRVYVKLYTVSYKGIQRSL